MIVIIKFKKIEGDLRTRSLKVCGTLVARLSGENPAGTSGTTLITWKCGKKSKRAFSKVHDKRLITGKETDLSCP